MKADLGISRDTARNVLKALRRDGLIYTLRGVGTFVGPPDAPRQVIKPDSKFREIAAKLAEEIKEGAYRPTRPIPSESDLTLRFKAVKGTVREAVKLLREQGWVYTVGRRGTYVSEPENWPQQPGD